MGDKKYDFSVFNLEQLGLFVGVNENSFNGIRELVNFYEGNKEDLVKKIEEYTLLK